MKWQPIETAPKDGTKLLLKFQGPFSDAAEDGIVTGSWSDYSRSWWLSSIWASSGAHKPPTHWMPLPSPPLP